MADDIATHERPVWREMANFLIFADLSTIGLPGRSEQLWAQQLSANEFVLCCVPFFTYGMALGDTVRTDLSEGRKYVIEETIARSGHRVLRLWLENATREGREHVVKYLQAESLLHEWSSDDLVAIDVPPHVEADRLLVCLGEYEIVFEWG